MRFFLEVQLRVKLTLSDLKDCIWKYFCSCDFFNIGDISPIGLYVKILRSANE